MSTTTRFLRASALTALLLAPRLADAGASYSYYGPMCGDVNNTGTITTSDALSVLKAAVGPFALGCASCPHVANYGIDSVLPSSSSHSPDYLLGSAMKVTTASTITHFGVIVKTGGPQVKMALYTDNGGAPDQLVVGSAAQTMVAGTMEFAVPATYLAAGTYWIMAVYSAQASVAFESTASDPAYKYRILSFGDPFPTTFGAASTETQQSYSYYVKVIQ